jgi:predicted RNase H-like nuclease (RuvC/YqgF family)
MEALSDIAHYAWAITLGVIGYFLKNLHERIAQDETRIRTIELEVQKQGAENKALFKRMDELRDSIRTLGEKIDMVLMKR